jgi:hypothetical protein
MTTIYNTHTNQNTLSKLNEKIETKKLNLKDDYNLIKKYFNDLSVKNRTQISKKIISLWDDKKIKILDEESLDIINYYLNIKKLYTTNDITICDKYKFSYIDYEEDNIRQENIFKLNFNNIVKKLNEYFTNVNITIEFEKATTIDKKIKKANATYKHDVIIKIKPTYVYDDSEDEDVDEDENDKNTYEIVLEYFEEIHNKFNDDDKKISTELFSDAYYIFHEKKDVMNDFMIDTLYSIIEFICATCKDSYELSKILYFNKNYKSKSYKKDVQMFNEIIEINRTNSFNFNDLYIKIEPHNPNTDEELTEEEFIEYIEEEYDIEIDDNFTSELFETLIINLDNDISETGRIQKYKKMYVNTMKTLRYASQKIIKIFEKQRIKRLQLSEFVKNIQKFHKDNLKI